MNVNNKQSLNQVFYILNILTIQLFYKYKQLVLVD